MTKYAIGWPKSKSHVRGWSKRGIRERQYEGWFKSFKDRTPTPEEIREKRKELGFGSRGK
jgi:hypothetical protein